MNKQIEGSADGVESTVPAQPGIDIAAIQLVSGAELLARTQPLPKWIDDMKGSDPTMDSVIEYIEQLRAAQPVQQPAPVAEPHYEVGRKQGRAEALAILMQLDPEGGIDEYTGWSTSVGPEDEGSAYWEEEKLRELFTTDAALADMMDKAEAQYWQYIGMQDEAERAKNFAANMHNSGRVREVLSKAREFDLVGQLCGTSPAAAPVAGQEAFDLIVRDVAELDYSGDIDPDMMQVTADDLRLIIERHATPVLAASVQPFQQRVQPWMMACFGAEISADKNERNHRFFEESTELVQAFGMTASEAHQLVDYVYGRPVGEPAQEVGGVMVTLAALCLANGLDMDAAAETELARIWTKVEAIRAKQAAKPKHSPLPQAVQQASGRDAALVEYLILYKHCMSYNDSYFSEPAGELKRMVYEADRAHPANVAQVGELSAPSVLEQAAQACDQQADGTNGSYRSACLQCADAVRELRGAAAKKGGA